MEYITFQREEKWAHKMGQIIDKIMGGDEGGGDAAVKRQAEGASNPMYALANLIGQVCTACRDDKKNGAMLIRPWLMCPRFVPD